MLLSFIVALLAFQVPMATWEKLAPWLFHLLAATADRRAHPAYRQGRERSPALDLAGAS
jgi:hypothetical protein